MRIPKNLIIFCSLLLTASLELFAARDLTAEFKSIYQEKKEFTSQEKATLRNYDIYLIPGILAESLVWRDTRSALDISLITKDYYYAQLKLFKKNKIPAERLVTSSYDVNETKENIRKAVNKARINGRKVIFMSHSLGGLVLLEEAINKDIRKNIAGIIFLQSPFLGTGLGDLLLEPPYELDTFVKKILPKVNISDATLEFVAPAYRTRFMNQNRAKVRELIKTIPLFTLSGVVHDSNKSIFKPTIDILQDGCLKGIRVGCLTDKFYTGPRDQSDGLIPLKSSFLENADYIKLDDVDHGEFILNVPFEDYEKDQFTITLFRMLLNRMK